jgi:hypothetical protein
MRATPWIPALALAAIVLTPPARAEGLVQISLSGTIHTRGGAPIEVELGYWDGSAVRRFAFNVHLGYGTRGEHLAALLAGRLAHDGARVQHLTSAIEAEPAHLFLDSATYVGLRLGHGLRGSVTLCDASPEGVRVLAPQVQPGSAQVLLTATTFHAPLRKIGRASLELDIDEQASASGISERLAALALEAGWMPDRPSPDRFACRKLTDGSVVTGFCVEVDGGNSDWRLVGALVGPRPPGESGG